MTMKKIGVNFLFSLSLKVSDVLFPLITFPYIARVLGPEGVGKVNFAQSYVSYFLMLAVLGIPMYGVREVAKVAGNRLLLSRLVLELAGITSLLVLISSTVLFASLMVVPTLKAEFGLFVISSLVIFINPFALDWFFAGLEEYRYIAVRNFFVKIVYVVSVFVFVHTAQDYLLFAFLGLLLNLVNCAFSMAYLLRRVDIDFTQLNFLRHARPIMSFFAVSVAVTLYYTISPVLLGFLSNPTQVGYFTTFLRVVMIASTLVTAFAGVVYPRFSALISSGDEAGYRRLAASSFSLMHVLIFFFMTLFVFFGKQIILLIAGEAFAEHIEVFWVIIPILYFGSLSQLLQVQVILPSQGESKVIFAPVVGVAFNLGLSFLLIPTLGALGSAISLSVAELAVFLCILWVSRRMSDVSLFSMPIVLYGIFNTGIGFVCWLFLTWLKLSFWWSLPVMAAYTLASFGLLFLVREVNLVAALDHWRLSSSRKV